jgi:hypothetical protein
MYDSTTAADIPPEAELVAGYINGRYAWKASDWTRFPTAKKAYITVTASEYMAIILDVERYDATPEQAPGWVRESGRLTGWVPTIYGSRYTLALVRPLMIASGLDCDYWMADPTGFAHLPLGCSLCQYSWPGRGSAGHYDVSLVVDSWPRPYVRPTGVKAC